ncbi:NinG protein [Chryseobacterium sp. T16E-39]|uniref:recombination protein NinG n=1 Tax=Chryseobacterium sp. T16E-39 TaxID=2015076 RepID=UPI000B5B257E|nr:recombination protein NinG [Chryseobacterium sp. T16E-39]ASK29749.1 NinG protein [Chryseobacterium sp. T16E-39]
MLTTEIKIKYKGRSIDWLEDKLQELINTKVRKRDSVDGFFICISCEELKPVNQMNAGHYFRKEALQYKAVRFDLDNIHGQCVRCNKYLSANLIPYRANLLLKIGEGRLRQLEEKAALNNFKFSREFLIEQIEKLKHEKS